MSDVIVKSEPMTYERESPHSFFADVARATALKDQRSMDRLERHAIETRTNPNTTAGTGGEFVPPAYLIQDFATAAKVGRHFANLVGSHPLPRGASSVVIPRIVGTNILGQDTAVQSQPGAVANIDDTTSSTSAPVVSIAGRVVITQQLFDQIPSNPGADTVYYTELQKDYNAVMNGQMVNGTGANGQMLGLANFTYPTKATGYVNDHSISGSGVGVLSPTSVSALWPLLGQVAAAVGNDRGHRPEFWLMAPRRWAAIGGALDSSGRPINSPSAMSPDQGTLDDAKTGGPHAVANVLGIPVYTEGAIPAGNGTDTIYCGRTGDMWLFESDPMLQTSVNANAGTLEVALLLHRYAAFVGNAYTSAVARVTAIPQPTNY